MSRRAVALAALTALTLLGCGATRTFGGPPLPYEAERMDAETAVARVHEALSGVPEIDALKARLDARGDRLVILREGDADPSEDAPRVWQIFVGDARGATLVRRWSFSVDAVSGAISVADPASLGEIPFARWREQLPDDPALRDPPELDEPDEDEADGVMESASR